MREDLHHTKKKCLTLWRLGNNLKKILRTLKKNNFPYIGFVYGGFDLIHQKSLEFNIELLFHNEGNCFLCLSYTYDKYKNERKHYAKSRK